MTKIYIFILILINSFISTNAAAIEVKNDFVIGYLMWPSGLKEDYGSAWTAILRERK